MGVGYLQVELYTGRQALPVPNATVIIQKINMGEVVFWEEMPVDENGKTEVLQVETPDISISMHPSVRIPYETYTVSVRALGYIPTRVTGVQVFPNNLALQRIEMVPLPAQNGQEDLENIYEIPPHVMSAFNNVAVPTVASRRRRCPNIPLQDGNLNRCNHMLINRVFCCNDRSIFPFGTHNPWPVHDYYDMQEVYPPLLECVCEQSPTDALDARTKNFEAVATLADVPDITAVTPPGPPEYPGGVGFILTEPKIPQFITVHLGKPQDYAKNVTVSFVDYIKNVASSEIYPTWPDAALRANIYAQISLALNRIYTEWYPSKGYDFDITNSTAYDQYFVFGRDIFENISQIVDEIFNEYIRKGNRVEPLFAQYCDGRQVTCDGMSQWGTVDLANQGYSPLRILRFYYGSDVNIVTGEQVENIPDSYPGTPLRVGDAGQAVLNLQIQLNRIARNYPGIPRISPATGQFTPGMEETVRTFQRVFNLTPDGIVGKATWYKINYIYLSVTKLAELQSEGQRPIYQIGAYPGYVLRLGSTGPKVQELQFYLGSLSKFYEDLRMLEVDGDFGAATEEAVRTYQWLFNLVDDGLVGEVTWNSIFNTFLGTIENVPSTGGGGGNNPQDNYPGAPLRQGSRGEDVTRLQTWLRHISLFYPAIPRMRVDGIFGPATHCAVVAYQGRFGLTPDGIVGPATWNSIRDTYTPIQDTTPSYPGVALRQGDRGVEVERIQGYLNTAAQWYASIPSISNDGIFGPGTNQAVIAFQRLKGLTPDGIVGRATWNQLYQTYLDLTA